MTKKRSALHKAIHRHTPHARSRAKVLKSFAHKIGLVYFGTVDQHNDEHEAIRGITSSTTYHDDHYAVGSYDGRDISIVDRSDLIDTHMGHSEQHWVIVRIPISSHPGQIVLVPKGYEPAYSPLLHHIRNLTPLNDFMDDYSTEFHQRYSVYASPDRQSEVEGIITKDVSRMVSTQLWPQGLELNGDYLYCYISSSPLKTAELNTALESALQLVDAIES